MNAAVAEIITRDERTKFLGGSDIAALLGIAPPTWERSTPLSLYMSKVHPREALDPRDTSRKVKYRGKRWEAVVAEMMVEKLKDLGHTVRVINHNARYTDPDYGFFSSEIDFEIVLDDEPEITNVELKTVHPFKAKDWGEEGSDECPVWYTSQALWGLGITRRRRCIVAALFGADEILLYPVDADQGVIDGMRAKALEFWENHVLPQIPPPPENLVDMKLLYPMNTVETIDVTNNEAVVDAIFELREIGGKAKDMESREKFLKLIVQQAMGSAGIATIGGHNACSWKNQKQRRLDQERLKAERPDVVADYTQSIEFRKFELTRARKGS